MPLVTLTPSQWDDLHKIQRGMLRELAEAMATLDAGLSADLKKAIIRLDRAGWSQVKVRVEIGRVLTRYWGKVDAAAIELIRSAERHADTYVKRLVHFGVAARTLEPIQPSKVAFWTRQGGGQGAAEAILAYARGKPVMAGAKQAPLALSRDLHWFADRQAQEVTQRVQTALREAQSLEYAARDLVSQWPRQVSPTYWTRGPISYKAEHPQIIKQIREHINNLGKLTGNELKTTLVRLRAYLPRLKPGGRMRLAYAELITDLSRGKAAEGTVEKWAHQSQRSHAERIMVTEQQKAFRMAQIDRTSAMPGLVGYRWRMNRSKHARFLRSKPGRFSPRRAARSTRGGRVRGLAGKHCICEAMDGTIISVEDYKTEWSSGGHPNCACFFEEVFDRDSMFSSLRGPESAEEKAFLDAAGF